MLPATGYLVWCHRDRLRELTPSFHAAGPLLFVTLVCAWFIGERTGDLLVQQMAVVAMLPALILTVMGAATLRRLRFPLGLLVFALPVGTSIEPWLQKMTALFIVTGLDLAGVPHARDGFLITSPVMPTSPGGSTSPRYGSMPSSPTVRSRSPAGWRRRRRRSPPSWRRPR